MTQSVTALNLYTYFADESPNGWYKGKKGAVVIDITNNIHYKYVSDFNWVDMQLTDWNSTTWPTSIANKVALSQVATLGTYASLTGKPTYANVANTGSYNDLINQPNLFNGDYNSLSNKPNLFDGAYNSLTGRPTLFDGEYSSLNNKPTLFSGSYIDLTNKPVIPASQVSSDWNAVSGITQILNKPNLFNGDYNSLMNLPILFNGNYNSLSNKPTLFNGDYNSLMNLPILFNGTYASLTGKPILSTVAVTGNYNDLISKPNLFSGSYVDLTNKPVIPASQVNSDWNAVSGITQILNKPTLATVSMSGSYSDLTNQPKIGKVVVGSTVKTGSFRTYQNATVVGGVAIFQLTDNGLSTGNALYSEVFTDSVQLLVNDATSSYQMSYVFSNSNKTLTVTANKLTTANLLSGILGQAQANSAVIKLTVEGV